MVDMDCCGANGAEDGDRVCLGCDREWDDARWEEPWLPHGPWCGGEAGWKACDCDNWRWWL